MSGTGHRVVVTEADHRLMDELLCGAWSVDDLIEAGVDEVSVAASVGSGPDRAIGMVRPRPFKDDALERLFKEFEGYLQRTQRPPTTAEVYQFTQDRALPESVETKLRDWIRRKR